MVIHPVMQHNIIIFTKYNKNKEQWNIEERRSKAQPNMWKAICLKFYNFPNTLKSIYKKKEKKNLQRKV